METYTSNMHDKKCLNLFVFTVTSTYPLWAHSTFKQQK